MTAAERPRDRRGEQRLVWLRRTAVGSFPVVVVIMAIVLWFDRPTYLRLLREDGVAEWLTFAFLLAAAAGAANIALRQHRGLAGRDWFFLGFAAVCLLGALEEISWGQRIFGFASPEFFLEHSSQSEINAHNVAQKWTGLKTKHVTGVVFFLYGAVLPLALRFKRIELLMHRLAIAIPQKRLVAGFAIAALMMFDKPTRAEEEIGEMLFSLALLFFVALTSAERPLQAAQAATARRTVPRTSRAQRAAYPRPRPAAK